MNKEFGPTNTAQSPSSETSARTIKNDAIRAFNYLDDKAGSKTETVLKTTGYFLLGSLAVGGSALLYNDVGPTTEIAHVVTEVSINEHTNTAIGAIDQAIKELAAEHGIDNNKVGNITNAGNQLSNARHMLPGTDISVTLEQKPFFGYEATASLLAEPVDVQTTEK